MLLGTIFTSAGTTRTTVAAASVQVIAPGSAGTRRVHRRSDGSGCNNSWFAPRVLLVRLKKCRQLQQRDLCVLALLYARSDPLAEAGGRLRAGSVPRVAEHDGAEIASVPDAPENSRRKVPRRARCFGALSGFRSDHTTTESQRQESALIVSSRHIGCNRKGRPEHETVVKFPPKS